MFAHKERLEQHTSRTRFSRDSKNFNLEEEEEDANHKRTGRPVVCSQRASHSSDQDIETLFSRECKSIDLDEETHHDRTERPVVCSQQEGSPSMSDEVDIDFRISGLPHSVVKQAESSRVRELIKKIENHPHRRSTTKQFLQPI